MMNRHIIVRLGVIAILILAAASSASAQCAMCRLSLTTSAEGLRLAGALREGILILIAAPFSVFAIIAAVAWRISSRMRAPEDGGSRST